MKQINLYTGETKQVSKSNSIKYSKDNALEKHEQEELIRKIEELKVNPETKLRYRVFIALIMEGGLRISEAIQARSSWINETEDGITLNIPEYDRDLRNLKRDWKPKTLAGKREVLFLDDKTGGLVKSFLISNKGGLGFSRQRGGQIITMLGKLMNKPKLHPHALRSTYANNLVYAGVNASTLMYYMGWANLQTAMNYVRTSKIAARSDLLNKLKRRDDK